MADKAGTLNLKWDSSGRISHNIKVENLSKDPFLWLFAPSAPMLLVQQFGSMKPSYGLKLCSRILEIIRTEKYILTPINTTLKNARIEFVWVQNFVMLQYFPMHAVIHNNDSLEEGSRQLVANYFYYVFSSLQEYGKLGVKVFSTVGILEYLNFIDNQLQSGNIGLSRDKWNKEFVKFSQETNYYLSSNFVAPDEWHLNPKFTKKDTEDWVNNSTNMLEEEFLKIDSKLHLITKQMGIA